MTSLTQRKHGLGATYGLLAASFLTMFFINIYSYNTVTNLSEKYANLNNAAMCFKLKVLNANLLFREIVSGYSVRDMNDVWTLIDEAKVYADSIGTVNESLKLSEDIALYKKTVLDCYKAKNIDRPSPELRKRYDKAISTMLEKVDEFEDTLKKGISMKMALVKLLYMALLVNIVIIFAFTVFLLWRHDKKIKLSEEEIISARNDMETLLNTLDSILITLDQKGLILQWNTKAEAYFGKSADIMIGRLLYNVLPSFKPFQDEIETVFLSKRGREHYHERMLLEGGRERYFNIVFTPLTQPGKSISGVLLRAEDITEAEINDEKMRQSQKMQVVENLIGGLAHDFNNVLGAITGTISMMRFSLESKASVEELTANVDLIECSAERAVVMVQQLLMLVQKQKADMVLLDLNSSVLHALRICQNSYDKRINIEANLYDVKALTKADPVQIALVILNLCDNAAQALTTMRKEGEEQGGTITIDIDRLCPDKTFKAAHPLATANTYWLIAIKDNGVGMEKDVLAKIFDPFFTTKKPGEGTGLGLTMVNETIKSHAGFIEVNSTPGKGSEFKVFLPEYVSTAEENTSSRPIQLQPVRKAPADNGIPVGNGLVLIVDDEAIMRKTARNILEKLGYQTVTAEDGDEAVKLYAERPRDFAVVLLDMSMPRMSGKDAYVEMKKLNPDIKAILVSGFKKDDRIQEILNLGVNAFVQKPYTMQMLAKEVKKVITDGAMPVARPV